MVGRLKSESSRVKSSRQLVWGSSTFGGMYALCLCRTKGNYPAVPAQARQVSLQ